jgi:hypothetical protein
LGNVIIFIIRTYRYQLCYQLCSGHCHWALHVVAATRNRDPSPPPLSPCFTTRCIPWALRDAGEAPGAARRATSTGRRGGERRGAGRGGGRGGGSKSHPARTVSQVLFPPLWSAAALACTRASCAALRLRARSFPCTLTQCSHSSFAPPLRRSAPQTVTAAWCCRKDAVARGRDGGRCRYAGGGAAGPISSANTPQQTA